MRDAEGKECRIPFNSALKYAFSVNYYEKEDSHFCVFMKGAPERIWARSTFIDRGGVAIPKT